MRTLLSFKEEKAEDTSPKSPVGLDLRNFLTTFHDELLRHANHHPPEDGEQKQLEEAKKAEEENMSWTEKLLALVASKKETVVENPLSNLPG